MTLDGLGAYYASLSPDGTQVAVDAEAGLMVGPLEGPLTPVVDYTYQGAGGRRWSPDGKKLAYCNVNYYGLTQIVDLTEAAHPRVLNLSATYYSPDHQESTLAWSPDSTRLVYPGAPHAFEVATLTGATSSILLPETVSLAAYTSTQFSRDGRYLFYQGKTAENVNGVYRTSVTTGETIRLLEGLTGDYDYGAIYGQSPDGSKLYLTIAVGNGYTLAWIPVDGPSTQANVIREDVSWRLRLSPDAAYAAYLPSNVGWTDVKVVRLSDGQQVSLGEDMPEGVRLNVACWLPGSRGLLVTDVGTVNTKALLLGTAPGVNLP